MFDERKAALLVGLVQVANQIIALKLLTYISLFATIGLTVYAMIDPDYVRAGICAGFAVLVLWPCLRQERSTTYGERKEKANSHTGEGRSNSEEGPGVSLYG